MADVAPATAPDVVRRVLRRAAARDDPARRGDDRLARDRAGSGPGRVRPAPRRVGPGARAARVPPPRGRQRVPLASPAQAGRAAARSRWPAPSPSASLEADELADALDSLPYRQRAALVLRFYTDLSDVDIASGAPVPARHRRLPDPPWARAAQKGDRTMSDLEQDLRDMLARRADAAPATSGDWQDLTVRMARRNRHSRRMLAGGARRRADRRTARGLRRGARGRGLRSRRAGHRRRSVERRRRERDRDGERNVARRGRWVLDRHVRPARSRSCSAAPRGDGIAIRALHPPTSATRRGNARATAGAPRRLLPERHRSVGQLSTDAAVGHRDR